MQSYFAILKTEFREFFYVKPNTRSFQIPILASLSVSLPLFLGLYFDKLQMAFPAALGGLVALYYSPKAPFAIRMVRLMVCGFGFILSYDLGLLFSFNPFVSSLILGVFSVLVHWVNVYYRSSAPGSFFFIMIAAMSCYLPHNLSVIPQKVGMLALGISLAVLLALFFSLLNWKRVENEVALNFYIEKAQDVSIVQSIIVGVFMFLAFYLGYYWASNNPFWIPISCLAIMQGVSMRHIWQRIVHRIIGTIVGVGLCWFLLIFVKEPIYICFAILGLQLLVELFITRHYALAVVFLTPLTIYLSILSKSEININRDIIALNRISDIVIGCILGLIGGSLIYSNFLKHDKIQNIKKNKLW